MIRPLPPDLQIIAETELNEKPEQIHENIAIIREWILKQPHLRAPTDDQIILTYLRGCKFRLEKVKQKIDHYYSLKTIAPEIFKDRDPTSAEMREIMEKGIFLPLETNTKGPQYFVCRLGVEGTRHIPVYNVVKFGVMLCDMLINEEDYAILGLSFMYDLKGASVSRLTELTISDIKKMLSLRHGLPVRTKSIIVINVPPVGFPMMETIKSLLGKKIGSLFISCPEGHLEELYKQVPISLLPKEYGGKACLDERIDYCKQKMAEYEDWFLRDATFGTDESKRLRPKFSEDYFGADGSFRKLEID